MQSSVAHGAAEPQISDGSHPWGMSAWWSPMEMFAGVRAKADAAPPALAPRGCDQSQRCPGAPNSVTRDTSFQTKADKKNKGDTNTPGSAPQKQGAHPHRCWSWEKPISAVLPDSVR